MNGIQSESVSMTTSRKSHLLPFIFSSAFEQFSNAQAIWTMWRVAPGFVDGTTLSLLSLSLVRAD